MASKGHYLRSTSQEMSSNSLLVALAVVVAAVLW